MINNSKSYQGTCYGSLGELYQGPFFRKNTVNISIITASSNVKTTAFFSKSENCNLENLSKYKVKMALDNYFNKISKNQIYGNWKFESDLKVGAGMSSSTADIVAALNCIAQANNTHLLTKDIIDCLKNIERSDPVFINYPCLYLSEHQEIIELYSKPKKIFCIYGLEEKNIETAKTKKILIEYYKYMHKEYNKLMHDVHNAFYSKNIVDIIKNSTKSAILSQDIFPKLRFNLFFNNMNKLQANGLIVAHTGSLIGFLYAKKPEENIIDKSKNFINSLNIEAKIGEIF